MRLQIRGVGPMPDISISGTAVTVSGVEIDAAKRQADSAQIIDIRSDGRDAHEGGDGRQLATVEIPPMRHQIVDTNETDEDGEPITQREPVELDPDHVLVTLWTR